MRRITLPSRAVALLTLAAAALAPFSTFAPFAPTSAHAQDDAEARFEALIGDALRAYTEGDYEKALDLYFKAKVMQNRPEIDYSIALCYQKLNKCSAAKSSYERVLNRPAGEAPQEVVDKAKKRLDDLASSCQEAKPDPVAVVEPPKPDPVKPDPTKPDPAKPDPVKPDPTQTDTQGGGVDWLAIGLMAGGGALVLAGLGTDLGSASLVEDYDYYNTDPTSGTNAERRAKLDTISSDITTRKVAVWSLYGVGAAALITGTVFLLMPDNERRADSGDGDDADRSIADRMYLQPAVNPDGAGLLLGGSF